MNDGGNLEYHDDIVSLALDAGKKVIFLGHPHPRREALEAIWNDFMDSHAAAAQNNENVWFVDTRVDPFPANWDDACTGACADYYDTDDSHPAAEFVQEWALPKIQAIFREIFPQVDFPETG